MKADPESQVSESRPIETYRTQLGWMLMDSLRQATKKMKAALGKAAFVESEWLLIEVGGSKRRLVSRLRQEFHLVLLLNSRPPHGSQAVVGQKE
jgi:mRNA-degrading endonuclease HigB of HigAB toxin-antitoxin module